MSDSNSRNSSDTDTPSSVYELLQLPPASQASAYPESGTPGVNTVRVGALEADDVIPRSPPMLKQDVEETKQLWERGHQIAQDRHARAVHIGETDTTNNSKTPKSNNSTDTSPPQSVTESNAESSSQTGLDLGKTPDKEPNPDADNSSDIDVQPENSPNPPNIDSDTEGMAEWVVMGGILLVASFGSATYFGGIQMGAGVLTGAAGVGLIYAFADAETNEDIVFMLIGVLLLVFAADFFELIQLVF
ncbi:FUSC family protein [Salinibaculum rarum]|uniref:FUSC family protein n=1 Tax=Salinibaculum rarum TaxID=3058903 RepID=UPI00265FC6ED|nr:FUSC family protein [Salinibaculum sp. KK48]